MKLPGDSDKQQGVSHEMMQRSLQSQRRVVKRVGLLEDRVSELETAEVEPGIELGDVADGAKKIATKIGDKAKDVGKSIGKNAQLLGDKAGKAAAGASAVVGKKLGQGTDKLTDVGKGIRNFIKDKTKLAKSLGKDKPKSPIGDKPEGETVSGTSTVKPPAPTTQPLDPLIPDPIAAQGKDKDGKTIYDKNERVRQFFESQGKEVPAKYAKPSDSPKVESLENVGASEEDAVDKVKKDLSDEFEVDEKMKKAFSDALALPAKSAAVAMTDLLEKIPAPSKEASKILNRNISKISQQFKLGAASSEVANDEEDNDNKEEGGKGGSFLGTMLAKAFNLAKGAVSGGGGTGDGAPVSGQPMLPPASGDPTYGRRAPYTGTADGIGLGDGTEGSRAMQPIKKRKSLASKLFGLTPMGMAFNAGTKIFQGAKGLAGKASGIGKGLKGLAGKAFGMTPMGMMAKFMMKNTKLGGIFSKGEQKTNLTELTDKTIQENRDNMDAKTKKAVDTAAGTGAAVAAAGQSGAPPMQSEGGGLAQPEIKESPYIDVYNVTSQF